MGDIRSCPASFQKEELAPGKLMKNIKDLLDAVLGNS